MKTTHLSFMVFTLLLFVTSCGLNEKTYAEEVFEKVAVNANKIPNGFKRHFTEMQAQLKNGSLVIVAPDNKVKHVTASEYVATHYVKMFDKDINAIQNLRSNSETSPILKEALQLFEYVDGIYKTDFPRIAKMIDDGNPAGDIDAAIEQLDTEKGPVVDEKFNRVHDLIMPYADKHGVAYKTIEMPQPIKYK